MKRVFCLSLICLLTLIVGACTPKGAEQGGHLDNYDQMVDHPWGGKVWRNQNIDPSKFEHVIVEPVKMLVDTNSDELKDLDPVELNALPVFFHQGMTKAVEKYLKPVNSPMPETIRIEAAITGITPSNPAMNTVTSVVPIGVLISFGSKAFTGEHTNVGSISYEIKFTDAESGELVAAYMDRYVGEKYDGDGMDNLGHAKKGLEKFAENLGKRVKETKVLGHWAEQ